MLGTNCAVRIVYTNVMHTENRSVTICRLATTDVFLALMKLHMAPHCCKKLKDLLKNNIGISTCISNFV